MTNPNLLLRPELLFDDDTDDHRISIDNTVPGKDVFVSRVEHAVHLQMSSSTMKHPTLTIPTFFANACRRYKRRTALVSCESTARTSSYNKYYRCALAVAKGLLAIGLRPMEGVAFTCNNTVNTFYCIMGTIMAGGIYVDLNATENRSWTVNTMTDAKVSVVFVDNLFAKDAQLDVWDEMPHMRVIVCLNEAHCIDRRAISINDLLTEGENVSDQELAQRLGNHAPNKCCAIFYRSNEILNQSSTPGVMMSHDNLTIMASLISEKILQGHLGHFPDIRTKALKLISILPITKPLAFVIELLLPMAIGGCVYTSNARLSTVHLWQLLTRAKPSIFCGTVKIWSHLRGKIMEKTRHLTKPRLMVFKYVKQTMLGSLMSGSPLPRVSRKVIAEITKRMGMEDVGLYLCFGEGLPQNYFEFFLSLNMQILALREVRYLSGPHALCLDSDTYRTEVMGAVLPEFQSKMVRLGKTSAYKMFVKGRHVCMGILHQSMDDRVDSDGFLDTEELITTIQEELFSVGKTADELVLRNGAVLNCSYVENSFKRLVPIISNCMLVGENMKTASLLITLKTTVDPETLEPTDTLSPEVQIWCEQKLQGSFVSSEMLACSKKLHVVINQSLAVVNRLIKRAGGWIDAYKIMPKNFSILETEVDPISNELNRNLILERCRDDLITLYPEMAS